MCFFEKKQVILKRTQSIEHNKIRKKASVSLCCPPCLKLLKRKKMSTDTKPLPFCALPLWDHGMKTQRVAGVRTIPAHRAPRTITESLILSLPFDKVQHLYMSVFQNGPPPGTTLQTGMSHCCRARRVPSCFNQRSCAVTKDKFWQGA